MAEVLNTYNANLGIYCRKHAVARVKELQKGERRATPTDDGGRRDG